jgi:hypothetical protein
MRPDFFRVPAGFNFDLPAVNIIREDFGGMTSFADSEIETIPGAMIDDNIVIIETVHCWTSPPIISYDASDAKAAPKVSDITPIINKLNKLGNAWCCQKEADNCTRSAPTARLGRTFAKSTKRRSRLSKHASAATMLDPRSGRSGVFAKISTPTRCRVMFGMFAPADHGCGN